MGFDLLLREVRLEQGGDLVDIAVADGRIAEIAPKLVGDGPVFAGVGRLVSAGLVESHIHLDKAGIIGRCRLCDGTLAEAVAETARAKAGFTEEDVYRRASRVVEQAVLHGTNRMRSFVEIDPRAGFRSFAALKAIKRDYEWAIDIELCAFAQEGLNNDPGTEAMLGQALTDGADLVGGCPYTDSDPADHVRRIFDLAQRFDVAVDFHVDFDLDPNGATLPLVISETARRGWGGRVSVGHVTKLSALPRESLLESGRRLAEAGVALVVLPATDLYLTGRDAGHLVPRGVVPAHLLAAQGALTSIASNNVLNPFTPFGDASLVRMANLYANVAQVGSDAGLAQIFRMISADAARVLGDSRPRLCVGAPADLVLFAAPTAAAAVAEIAPTVAGWKGGRASFRRPPAKMFSPYERRR
jgi:cytosine deaminase